MGTKQKVNHSLGCVSSVLQGAQADVPALHHAPGEVAAVLTLHGDVLGALELRLERVGPAREEEEHGRGLCVL